MEKGYREIGIETYGNKCELCSHGLVEVHHIAYNEHQAFEDKVRKAYREGSELHSLLEQALKLGYETWDGRQLGKDNRSTNLAVLCPNCHTLVHTVDMGKKLLKALPPRR